MVGTELLALVKQKSDEAYTQYWSNARWNRAAQQALLNVIQKIYNDRLNFQNSYDEISYLVATAKTFTVNNATNTIYLGDHTVQLISVFPSGTTLTCTTALPHDLETGMLITFSNIVATGTLGTIINQTYTVTVTDSVTFTVTTITALTGTFTSGQIIFPESILDYFHFLRAEVRFTQLTDFTVIKSTNATPIKITLNTRSYFMDGDQIVISGIGGNTNANGTFYLKQANDFDYFLYSDKYFRVPAVGNGTQSGTGAISEIFKSTVRFKQSDEKGSIYSKPTVQSPYYQQAKNFLKILPSNQPCDWIKIDYLRKPTYFIDVTDSTYDIGNNYNLPMQYQIVNEMCIIFAQASRDQLLLGEEVAEITKNI